MILTNNRNAQNKAQKKVKWEHRDKMFADNELNPMEPAPRGRKN